MGDGFGSSMDLVMGMLMGNGSGIGLEVGKNTRERNERRSKMAC